jgi:hypothetical protein
VRPSFQTDISWSVLSARVRRQRPAYGAMQHRRASPRRVGALGGFRYGAYARDRTLLWGCDCLAAHGARLRPWCIRWCCSIPQTCQLDAGQTPQTSPESPYSVGTPSREHLLQIWPPCPAPTWFTSRLSPGP